ncbi:hypothetical protein DL98DRAFT_516449 [Cadophora sp. DSE1049]|nr:hypothetical protein DL98DRAFT_516449 [Cadophora sp. DSE1049]
MPQFVYRLAAISVLILLATVIIPKIPLTILSTTPPQPSYEPGLRWFHPEGAPSVDEWEDKLRGHKIFLGPSYHLRVPNPSSPNFGFPRQTRFIFPNSVTTDDWVEERLNVRLDWDGTVLEVVYG